MKCEVDFTTALAPSTMIFVSLFFDAPVLALFVDGLPLHFICVVPTHNAVWFHPSFYDSESAQKHIPVCALAGLVALPMDDSIVEFPHAMTSRLVKSGRATMFPFLDSSIGRKQFSGTRVSCGCRSATRVVQLHFFVAGASCGSPKKTLQLLVSDGPLWTELLSGRD